MERENNLKILLLDQGRQSLPFLRSLSKAGHEVYIVCNTRISEGYFSRYPAKRLLWPSYMTDPELFEQRLIDFLKHYDIDITLSVGDISSEILSKNRDQLEKYTRLTVPKYSKFTEVTDKFQLMQYCMQHDIPCPKTYKLDIQNSLDWVDDLSYPVIVKPRRGVGAIGVQKFDDPISVRSKVSKLSEKFGPLLIQEFIPQEGGTQYQAQVFLDQESNMKVCMVIEKPRFFPVNGGTSTANVTVNKPEIVNTCKKLMEGIGWTAAADVDLILDPRDNIIKILEVNPRVTAGIKIGFAAGIDYADLHVKYALGQPIPDVESYKLGVYCRNIFMELMWYLYSNRMMKKKTKPSFFRFFGRDVIDQTFSIDDPLAGFGFFFNMLRKYMNINYLREKLGRY